MQERLAFISTLCDISSMVQEHVDDLGIVRIFTKSIPRKDESFRSAESHLSRAD